MSEKISFPWDSTFSYYYHKIVCAKGWLVIFGFSLVVLTGIWLLPVVGSSIDTSYIDPDISLITIIPNIVTTIILVIIFAMISAVFIMIFLGLLIATVGTVIRAILNKPAGKVLSEDECVAAIKKTLAKHEGVRPNHAPSTDAEIRILQTAIYEETGVIMSEGEVRKYILLSEKDLLQ